MFRNRTEAGRLLAARLGSYAGLPGLVVLGLPRGGVPVAGEVARELDAPLDVLVVRKLGVPCRQELAMGAIAPDGVCSLNDELIDLLDIEGDAIGVVRRREERELARREQLYRGGHPPLDVSGRTVIVVDDGVATGSTMHAAVVFLHRHDAARVVVAVPVMAFGAFRELQTIADEVVAVVVPESFQCVAQWYEDFSAVADADVARLLSRSEPAFVPVSSDPGE